MTSFGPPPPPRLSPLPAAAPPAPHPRRAPLPVALVVGHVLLGIVGLVLAGLVCVDLLDELDASRESLRLAPVAEMLAYPAMFVAAVKTVVVQMFAVHAVFAAHRRPRVPAPADPGGIPPVFRGIWTVFVQLATATVLMVYAALFGAEPLHVALFGVIVVTTAMLCVGHLQRILSPREVADRSS